MKYDKLYWIFVVLSCAYSKEICMFYTQLLIVFC